MSEKDHEPLMKQTPLDGTPHFDVAAPGICPKRRSQRLGSSRS